MVHVHWSRRDLLKEAFQGVVYLIVNYLFLPPKLVNCTHLAELVKKGVVDQRDASPMCSASQTPMGVPVPQAGRVCSAMKVRANHTPEPKRSCLAGTPRKSGLLEITV